MFTSIGAIISVIYSLTIPEKYVSQAISVKAEISSPTNNDTAGGLPNFWTTDKSSTDKTLTILKSKVFKNFYDDDQFLFELMAVESYDIKSDQYNIDNDLYADSKWIQKPSFEKSFEVFHQEFKVSSDLVTGEIYTTTKHVNPKVALNWNAVLAKINEITKEKQVVKSSSAIEYYRKQLNSENSLAVKSVLMSAMASEFQPAATSNVTDEYSLEVIDPPFLPERSSEPNNAVISIFGTILSFIVFFLYFVIVDLLRLFKTNT